MLVSYEFVLKANMSCLGGWGGHGWDVSEQSRENSPRLYIPNHWWKTVGRLETWKTVMGG